MILNYTALDAYLAGFSNTSVLKNERLLREYQMLITTAVFEGDSRTGPCTVSQRVPGGPFQCGVLMGETLDPGTLAAAIAGTKMRIGESGYSQKGQFEFTLLTVVDTFDRFWVVATDVYLSDRSPFV